MLKFEADDLVNQLSTVFTPDDAFMFGPESVLDFDHVQRGVACSKESPSSDGVSYLTFILLLQK